MAFYHLLKSSIGSLGNSANIIIEQGHSDLSYRKTFGLIGTGLTKNAFITNMPSLDWKFSWNIFKTEGYTNPKLLCRHTSMDDGTLRTDQPVTKHEWKYSPQ